MNYVTQSRRRHCALRSHSHSVISGAEVFPIGARSYRMPVQVLVFVGSTHIEYKLAYPQCRYSKDALQFFSELPFSFTPTGTREDSVVRAAEAMRGAHGQAGDIFREQILPYCEARTRSWFFVSQEPSLETKTEAIFQRTQCGGPSCANDCCQSKVWPLRPLALEKCQAGRGDRSKVTMYLPQSPIPDPSTSIGPTVPPSTPSYSTIMN